MSEDFVIHYGADLSAVTSDLRKLERINARVAKEFGNDFVKASQVVSNSLDKISQSTLRKKIPKKLGGGFKDIQKTVIETGTVVKLTNGEFRRFGETLTFLNGKLQKPKTSLKNVTEQMRKQEVAAKKGGNANKTFAQNIKFLGKRALTVIPIWLVLRSVLTGFTRILSSSLKFLIDWEFQMAQIKLVGKESAESIDILSDSMLNLATSLGISNEQLGEAAKLFIQQGRSISEIIPLLDATAKLSLLTGRTTVQSVEDLTAVLKAFSIDAEKAITVVDLITNTMLNNAITAADLTTAYKQVASSAAVLGISLAGLTGFITAIKAETRDAGGKIGLSLRTMFTRISTVSADALQNLTDIPLFLDKTGKATKTATNKLRNLERVISDLSIAFATAGDADQVRIAKLVGGVRRTNQAIVLFKNYNQVIKAQTDALLGLGKADKAIATLLDTTKIRIQSLTNEWKEFVDAVGDTSVIKSALTFLKIQIEGLSAIIDPSRSLFTGLIAERQRLGQEFQRDIQLAKNFTEILSLVENLSDQMGLAEIPAEFDLINERAKIIFKQIQAFNRSSTDIEIDIGTEFVDIADMETRLKKQTEKFIDFQVQAQINFDRTQLQSEILTVNNELKKLLTHKGRARLSIALDTRKAEKQFKEIAPIFKKLSRTEFITQQELNKVRDYAKNFKFTNEQVEGLNNKFNKLLKIQNSLVDVSGLKKRLQIRKQITRELDRAIKIQLTSEQVAHDLFKLEIESIRENKTKQQILESQLEILERQGQTLNDQLLNKLKSIRKELQKIRATEEQQILKTLIADQIERLRLAGALNSVILKRKTLLEDQFNINRSFSENLARQLQLERDINKEKRLGTNISSTDLKLFRIARDEGIKAANRIRDVLTKEADFGTFVQIGGDVLDIFKRDFGDIFEQEQARLFNIGLTVPGEKGLRGGEGLFLDTKPLESSQKTLVDTLLKLDSTMRQFTGSFSKTTSKSKAASILESPEERLFLRQVQTNQLNLAGSKLPSQVVSQLVAPQITVPVNVSVDVSSLNELAANVEDKLAQNIIQVGTKVHNAVKNVVLAT